MQIEAFICHKDNIAVLLHDEISGKTLAIDAPDGDAIARKLKEKSWQLDTLLITHHHNDHTAGIAILREQYKAMVIGPQAEQSQIQGLDQTVINGDTIYFAEHEIEVIATPGHTLDSVCFYLPEDKLLFAGDTLFSLGCGRLFEGTATMMLESLRQLRHLPADTQLYCGHDYTYNNGRFALTIEPGNPALQKRMKTVTALHRQGRMTLPVMLGTEYMTNPFLRWDAPQLRTSLDMVMASDEETLKHLRQLKDNFS